MIIYSKEMSQLLSKYIFVFFCVCFLSCSNDIAEVNKITQTFDVSKDVGTNVKIVYSDSAFVKVIVEAPTLERYNDVNAQKDVFPNGILVSFLDENKVATSWLKADRAERNPRDKKMIAKGNVVFYNAQNDKLQTSELIWDENTKQIKTEKFIRITQPTKGDTIYGIGFVTDQNFKRIEIKKKIKARLTSGEFLPK
jgi:LPS export ABC transporter protein LptC